MKNISNLLRGNAGIGYYSNSTAKESELGENSNGQCKTEEVMVEVSKMDEQKPSMFIRTEAKSMDERRWSQKSPNLRNKSWYDLEWWKWLGMVIKFTIIVALVCTLTIPNLRNKSWYDLEWWRWLVMVIVVIWGRFVSGWGIQIVVSFIERKRVLYFLYPLKKAAQNWIWWGLTSIAWQCVLLTNVEHGKKVRPSATKICICFFLGHTVWLVKAFIIEVLASRFLFSKYLDRIQDSLLSQYAIEKLSGPPDIQQEQEDVKIEHLLMTNISAWIMHTMMDVVTTDPLTTFGEASTQITTQDHAISAAEKIFCNVVEPGSDLICIADLRRFLSNDQALNAIMRLFDGATDQAKKISKQALKNWVVNVLRERRALALSLEDIKRIVDNAQQMLNAVLGIIMFVICLRILEITGQTNLFKYLGAILLLASFLFAGQCQATLGGLWFVLVRHPFDVGDLCKIGDDEMLVEKMHVLKTVFLGHANQKIEHSNNDLSAKFITNYRRSPNMREDIRFCVHVSTSTETIAEMEERIKSYVENNQGHWQPGLEMVVRGVVDSKRKTSLLVSHQMNFQDMCERFRRRASLVEEMVKTFEDLKIEFSVDNHDDNIPVVASNRSPSTWIKKGLL